MTIGLIKCIVLSHFTGFLSVYKHKEIVFDFSPLEITC